MQNTEENCEMIWKTWKKDSLIVKKYGYYGRNPSWIAKRNRKYGRKVSWILIWFGKYGRNDRKKYQKYGNK
jgi:hypothetical protein